MADISKDLAIQHVTEVLLSEVPRLGVRKAGKAELLICHGRMLQSRSSLTKYPDVVLTNPRLFLTFALRNDRTDLASPRYL